MKEAVEFLHSEYKRILGSVLVTPKQIIEMSDALENAKEIDNEQIGYTEEDVRLAYFQGEKDSYIKGGQTKEMEDEFIQSLKQKKQQEQ